MIRIAAVADIHSPRFIREFKEAIADLEAPDLFLFAGDMINFGRYQEYHRIIEILDQCYGPDLRIIGCYGNEEYNQIRPKIQSEFGNRITFLEDQSISLTIQDHVVGVLGISTVQGHHDRDEITLDRSLMQIFEEQAVVLADLLQKMKSHVDCSILLMHYSPVSDENDVDSYSWWISKVVRETKPDFLIHGHIHSRISLVRIEGTRVLNVALPAAQRITEIILVT